MLECIVLGAGTILLRAGKPTSSDEMQWALRLLISALTSENRSSPFRRMPCLGVITNVRYRSPVLPPCSPASPCPCTFRTLSASTPAGYALKPSWYKRMRESGFAYSGINQDIAYALLDYIR
jgi:hypothetical protein